ncbi:tumor necrosis factor receptor superfamily member 1B isoform X2 [Syngnathoides biaculeatus]|uniref:tumor necrosis factor receptor superfamily member 1B isoform X2 n=1 Tax=Syngnathoides biaculeatus TaxID=300417 RepID=UPI002ADDC104|nr:tumor necrosis factor receptor superfamily member 1B isoform X2 [Syngnathoides biaculeatus]
MKEVQLLLLLVMPHTLEVLSLPYHAESTKKCKNPDREYLLEALGLCCKKCPPGMRLTRECNRTSESVCEPCEREQYMESWNYARKCFPCAKCKTHKGLQYADNCSSTAMSKCVCRPGMYCIMESDEQHCTACQHHMSCKAGYGVFLPGTEYANVKCKRCLNGTFSDTSSSKEPCRPHTNCHGRPVLRPGTSTSDTVCKPGPLPHVHTSGNPNQTTTTTPASVVSGTTDVFFGPVVLKDLSASSLTKSPRSDGDLVEAVASVVGTVTFLVIVAVVLVVLYKTTWSKGSANLHPKAASNGNLESGNEFKTLRASFTAISPGEQRRLLQSTDGSCDSSHCSGGDARSSHNSQESIGAVQSALALRRPQDSPPGSGVRSYSVCPASAGPHVNVSITLNIGDWGSPSPSRDSKTPLGQEEESFPMPKQEAGKELPERESVE